MRYIEWAVMFLVAGVGIALANFVGFQVNFMDSVPGILILLAISFVSVVISKLVPFKLPVIAYCSLIGLLVASPLCPAREFVIEAAGVYLASGLRGALSHSSMDQGNFPDSIRQTTEEVLASEDRLFDEFHGKGNLKVFYSLRALMNCSTALIRATAGRATERNTFFQAHMNEYAGEVNYTLEKFQLRPVEYLDSLGVLNADFLSAHSIMVSAHERSLLAENQVKVVHCPFSNCGKGVPDTPSLLEQGICTGLGTDGTAHGGLSLWNEMKIFRSVMNAFWGVKNADPAVMPAKTILKMATENGAHLLGEEKSGVLKEGFKADLISINWRQPHLLATNNPVNTLLECVCGNDVSDSIVNGKLLMRNRQVLTLDEEKILWQAEKYFTSGEVSE